MREYLTDLRRGQGGNLLFSFRVELTICTVNEIGHNQFGSSGRSPSPPKEDAEEKKRQRLAKLAAWKKSNQSGNQPTESQVKKEEQVREESQSRQNESPAKAEEAKAW